MTNSKISSIRFEVSRFNTICAQKSIDIIIPPNITKYGGRLPLYKASIDGSFFPHFSVLTSTTYTSHPSSTTLVAIMQFSTLTLAAVLMMTLGVYAQDK